MMWERICPFMCRVSVRQMTNNFHVLLDCPVSPCFISYNVERVLMNLASGAITRFS